MPRLLPARLACFFLSFFLMQKAAAQQWETADTTKAKALIDEFVKQGSQKKSPENDLRLDTLRRQSEEAIASIMQKGISLCNGSDYKSGQNELLKALMLAIKLDTVGKSPLIADIYQEIGRSHQFLGNIPESRDFIAKSMTMLIALGEENSGVMGRAFNSLATCFMREGKPDSAMLAMRRSLAIQEKAFGYESKEAALALHNLATVYTAKRQYDSSAVCLKRALIIRQSVLGNKAPLTISTLMAQLHLNIERKKFDNARENVLQVKSALGFTGVDSIDALIPPRPLAEVFGYSALLHYKIYESQKDISHIDTAISESERSMVELERLMATLASEDSKAAAFSKFRESFSVQITCYNIKYKATNDATFQEKIFRVLDITLARNLRKQLLSANALSQTGIPQIEIDKLAECQKSIAQQQTALFEGQSDGASRQDSSYIARTLLIESAKRDYDSLQTDLAHRFPKYAHILKNTAGISLSDFRRLLEPKQCLLAYLKPGQSFVMAVVITQSDVIVLYLRKKVKSLRESAASMLDGLTAFHATAPDDTKYAAMLAQYEQGALELYQTLIAPLDTLLAERVILIAEEEFTGIPFEALLSAKPAKPGDFSTYPFLAKKFAFSYAYAPAMLMPQASFPENPSSNTGRSMFLGIAPWFDGTSASYTFWSPEELRDEAFQPLRYSGQEILDAQKIWGGRALTGPEASEHNFFKHAPGAKIIHLATHGQSDPRIGDYSWLAFAPQRDSTENELLFARELAPINLTADLVILSACKTGVARFQRGEGMLGLPRAFVLAGAKSVLATQWAVNDASAAALMQQFHRRLAAGKPKDVALQEAKIAFLKKHGSAAHPYFWSGFLLTGSTAPIRKK